MYNLYDIDGLGEKIKQHRQQIGLTQKALAEKLGVSFQAVSGWEHSTTVPDIENLCRLSIVFGVTIDELLTNTTAQSPVMIGIDGGGSKTEFALFNAEGQVLKTVKLSGCNAALVGIDETLHILYQGMDACLNAYPGVCSVFAGLAGPKLDEIRKKLSEAYPKLNIRVDSDGVNAYYNAEGDFAMICGTGSILVTRADTGFRRIGGWGARFGDPGSAYNIGRAVLQCAFAYEDGLLREESLLYRLLVQKTGISNFRTSAGAMDVPYIAGLSAVVFDGYQQGDPYAAEILQYEMQLLASLLDRAFPAGGKAVVCGGIMKHYHSILLPLLRERIQAHFEFILPVLPPVYGACVACCKETGIPVNAAFEKAFELSYFTDTESR